MRKTLAVLLFTILTNFSSNASVTIEFGESLNYSTYPNLTLKIKVYKDGKPVSINQNQILVLEGYYPILPNSLTEPDFEGYQKLNWVSTSPGFSYPKIFVTVEDETGFAMPQSITSHPLYSQPASLIKFVDNDRNIVKEIRFGNVPVGSYTNQRINVASAIQKSTPPTYYPTRIDWVGTSSDEFKYLWLGSNINTNPPPVDIVSPYPYAIEVLYIPKDTKYKREYLTVSYDNGRKSHIALVANTYPIPKKPLLKLKKPSAEEVLFPCQNYTFEWSGNKTDVPVVLEYTTNKGKEWNVIDSIAGNKLNWIVPNIETDSLFIRITQNNSRTAERLLSSTANQPQKIALNDSGTQIISASKDGKITILDVNSKTEIESITFTNINFPLENAIVTGLSYFQGDSFAIVSYRWADFYGVEKNDTLFVINLYDGNVVGQLHLNEGEKLKKFVVDKDKWKLLLAKENQNNIEVYDLPQLTFREKYSFNSPIQEIAIRNRMLAVALLSNKIYLLSLEDFTKISEFEVMYQPLVTNLAISNDGRFIAYTTKKDNIKDVLENLSDAFVVEVQSGQIVRSLYKNWSDAIGIDFSPTDNFVIIGFENNPSIVIWDLVNDVRSTEIYGSGFNISDFKVSSNNFLVAYAEPIRSLITLREFTYPESIVAGPFKIHKPKVLAKTISFPPQKIYYPTNFQIDSILCNIGDVPFIIQNYYFKNGRNFSLGKELIGDTLLIGNCLPLNIIYNPKDTGTFADTLVILSCSDEFKIPLNGKGLNRDFKFIVNNVNFGQVCINDTAEIEIDLGSNNDSLELPINFVRIYPDTQRNFDVISGNDYQVLSPGGKLKVKIRFHPKQIGQVSSYIEIYYLGQWDYVFRIPVSGEGFGVDISLSTNDLRFIPEIPTREITLKNTSNVDILIDSLVFSPEGFYIINLTTPLLLPANTAKIVQITRNAAPTTDVVVKIYSSPCSLTREFTIGEYIGTSTIILPKIETEPKGVISIPIEYKNSENKPYNGRRFFESEILVNPHMFLPLTIESEYGTATITKNQIIGDRRVIGFRVEGDFPTSGTIAKIYGNVGLNLFDTTLLEFNKESIFWGKNVQVNYLPGIINLTGLCGNRRLSFGPGAIKDLRINPNPANEFIDLEYILEKSVLISVEIFDLQGNLVYVETFLGTEGLDKKRINTSSLSNGLYRLVLIFENFTTSSEFVIFRL